MFNTSGFGLFYTNHSYYSCYSILHIDSLFVDLYLRALLKNQ